MNIEALAREAGRDAWDVGLDRRGVLRVSLDGVELTEELERFAALVLGEAAAACKRLEEDAERQSGPEAAGWLEKAADAIRAIAATKPAP